MNNQVKQLKLIGALIALGLLVQIGASYLMNGILNGVAALSEIGEAYGEIEDQLTQVAFKVIIQVILISPVIEELVFRFSFIGLGLKLWTDVRSKSNEKVSRKVELIRFAIIDIASSLLFGIYHGNIVQGVYAFLLGLMLGYIFYFCGGIFASILVHIVINCSGLYLTPLLPCQMSPEIMIVIGTIVMALSIVLMEITGKYNQKVNIK